MPPAASPIGGTSEAGAQASLQDELRQRTGQQCTEVLKPNSRLREAAGIWMGKIRERLADSTGDTDASGPRNQVLPRLGELRLSECDTAHLDAFFSRLERARKVVELPDGTRGGANTRALHHDRRCRIEPSALRRRRW